MNIFQLFTFASVAGGAIYGGSIGFGLYRIFGACVGIPVGGAVGYGLVVACLFIFACFMSVVTGGPLFKPKGRA